MISCSHYSHITRLGAMLYLPATRQREDGEYELCLFLGAGTEVVRLSASPIIGADLQPIYCFENLHIIILSDYQRGYSRPPVGRQ